MKFNRIILISLLMVLVSFGAVSAAEDANSTDDAIQSASDDVIIEDMQTADIVDDKLDACEEEIAGDMAWDNVTVDVGNVFRGHNATVSVTVPRATGTVIITVGENIYTPEFINGVATQNISQYSIGLNNVTVNYNGILKQTSFKALDGVVTQETFEDYYEYIQGVYVQSKEIYKRYKMFDYIPEGAVLDFRGLINITNVDYAFTYVRSLTYVSSTKDAVIDGNIRFNMNSHISDINVTGDLFIYNGNNINNVTVKGETKYGVGSKDISICNSRLLGGLTNSSSSITIISNITVKNCIIYGDLFNRDISVVNVTIEDNIINGYIGAGVKSTVIIRNNIITSSGSKYAIDFSQGGNKIVIVNNTVYNYGYDYAIWIPNNVNVISNRLFSNNFGNNAIKIRNNPNMDTIIIENNTPDQIPIVLTNTKRILYDENVSISVSVSRIGNVTIDINGKRYDLQLVNGNADLTISEYLPGTNMIRVYYSDVENDIYGYEDATFFVEKIDSCPVVLEYGDAIVGKCYSVKVILPEDAKGTITFRIFNSTHYVKGVQYANGRENIIRMPNLSQGDYMMNVTFVSEKYVTNSSNGNIRFILNPVYKLTANNIVMNYNDGSKYKVLVTKDGKAVSAGEVVKITFNGKTSNVKTDNNGYAIWIVSNLPGKYTVTASYNGQSVKNTIQVKQNLKASKVTVKKSAKLFVLKATLSKLKGKKLTFKFNGKIYTAKTDKKGVAKVKIKKNIIKKLKKGKKYTFTVKYVSNTVKSQVIVK